MVYAVKCSAHYPGYEIAHAPSVDLLKSQIDSWRTCKADPGSILEIPDGWNNKMQEGEEGYELIATLKVWTDEFTKVH